ncbi:MAG: hypothetical protein CME67_01875 [Halobacteriovoraceae bacterium]|nr:hypothetical protein [Halobacteriovoraceae bacterium]|tara:strand:- start:3899 stop:4468 length:570 start_codon:yes stop_codon:yes gene_type:complete
MMQKKLIIASFIVLSVFGYAVFNALKLDGKLESSKDYFQTNTILKKLPDTSLPIFKDGNSLEMSSLKGLSKTIVVHFWASWCGPCEEEFPALLETTKKLKQQNVLFLFVAVNDKRKDIIKFLKKYKALGSEDFILLVDDEQKHQKYFGTYKLPETYVFDQNLNLVRRFSGAQDWAEPEFFQFFQSLNPL